LLFFLDFYPFYIFQILRPLTSKQLLIGSCHSEINQVTEDIINKTRVMEAAKCKILMLTYAVLCTNGLQ